MSISELTEQDKQHHIHPLTNPVALRKTDPEIVVRAEGIYFHTSDGRRIMDVNSGLNNVNIGYGNKRLCEAAYATMQQLSYAPSSAGRTTPWVAALASKLNEITPESFQQFFFASTGSEAVESSIKLALRYWRLLGRPEKRAIISRKASYHGNTLFAASLTGMEVFHPQFGLPLPGMIHHADTPYWYRDGKGRSPEQFGLDVARALEKQILEIGPEKIAAFIGEPVQIGGGTIIPPPSYWPEVRRICDRYEILLLVDEVITGFGKTGRMFGFECFDFEPDLFAMAKGLSSGYFPISAVGIGRKVGEVLQNADEVLAHIFTNCGHPVGAAVALENIAIIEEQRLVERVRTEIGPYLSKRLNELLEIPFVGEVRSLGVLGAIDYNLPKEEKDALYEKVRRIAWRRGLATRGAMMCLPMIITLEQIDEAMTVLKESIIEASP